MSHLTALDLAKLNGNDIAIGIIEESLKSCPELANFPARQVKGTSYTTVRRTGRPTVGFRFPNSGIDASKSTFAKDIHEMFILGGRVAVDKAIADAYELGPEALKGEEAVAVGQGSLETVGKQVWYGTSASEKGFSGIQQACGSSRVTKSDTSSSASTKTSVYLVRYGIANGVSFDFGANSTLELSDWRVESLLDSANNPFPAYVADLSGWIGLSIKTLESVWRIANVGKESGKVGLSDKIIADALSNWRGAPPDAIYMNRTAAFLLQCSRTFTLTGSGKIAGNVGPFAPAPTESNNIPIVITDALVDDETFVS